MLHYYTHEFISFAAPGCFMSARAKDGATVLSAVLEKDVVTVAAFYPDFSEAPLLLTADCKVGNRVLVRFCTNPADNLDFRIELEVSGVLRDEEWPCGKLGYDELSCEGEGFHARSEGDEPTVTDELESAEGWCPGNGVLVGDCMPYTDGGRYHVLYLKDRHRHRSKWRLGAHQWEHISTADFVRWQVHPMAVPITNSWEASICTGSHIRTEGKHYLWYTVRAADGGPAPIMRSVSTDGFHFHKDTDFRFTLSDRYNVASARDPKVFIGADGRYHMLLTTTLLDCGKGCLAHLVSEDLEHFEELAPIYVAPDENEPECSDYLEYGGFYYLIFSHHGRGEYRYSRSPFDGWQTPDEPVIPCSSVPKAAIFGDKLIFAGFKSEDGEYAGTMTFKAAVASEDGQLLWGSDLKDEADLASADV